MAPNTLYYVVAAIVVIAVVAVVAGGGLFGGSTVAVQLTDPPNVPSGTQHLFVTYTSVQVHVSSTGYANATNQSGWVTASGSGTVDLMTLLNASQTLAAAHVTTNSTVNLVRFNISSATIVISNQTYNVITPNNQITVTVVGGQKINSSSASVLIQLSPTVTVRGGAGANTTYMLVPAARAIVINSSANVTINTNVGAVVNMSAVARGRLGLGVG
ncbi:MAG: DUF4382 domain-containing protein [Candidatus Micrarchaeota archaeon]|nr:DUF4382 domain-containing protein [Candidatus Micrarchaeota archaeon]